VLMLVWAVGLHWLLALLFVMLTGLLFLIVTRINVETGLFFIQPTWHAVAILLGIFGIKALGPNMLIILALLSVVMTIDPRVCLMPLVANALRFSEREGVAAPRLSWAMGVTVLLALVAGVFGTIYVQYNYGAGSLYEWGNIAAAYPFEILQRSLQGFWEDPGQLYSLRLEYFSPDGAFLKWAGAGAVLVLLCSTCRLRYSWWPIHPVLFLVWGTAPACWLGPSFFVGWLLKTLISQLGGSRTYQKSKPIFIGFVAGEFAAGILWAIVGLIYYLQTGTYGPMFRVHP